MKKNLEAPALKPPQSQKTEPRDLSVKDDQGLLKEANAKVREELKEIVAMIDDLNRWPHVSQETTLPNGNRQITLERYVRDEIERDKILKKHKYIIEKNPAGKTVKEEVFVNDKLIYLSDKILDSSSADKHDDVN